MNTNISYPNNCYWIQKTAVVVHYYLEDDPEERMAQRLNLFYTYLKEFVK